MALRLTNLRMRFLNQATHARVTVNPAPAPVTYRGAA